MVAVGRAPGVVNRVLSRKSLAKACQTAMIFWARIGFQFRLRNHRAQIYLTRVFRHRFTAAKAGAHLITVRICARKY